MPAPAGPVADDPFAHTRMTLGEHLEELRKRLFRGIAALIVAFVVSLYFNREITVMILHPYHWVVERLNAHYEEDFRGRVAEHPELHDQYFEADGTFKLRLDERLAAIGPTESMWFVLKVAGIASIVLGAPVLLWQLWQFV